MNWLTSGLENYSLHLCVSDTNTLKEPGKSSGARINLLLCLWKSKFRDYYLKKREKKTELPEVRGSKAAESKMLSQRQTSISPNLGQTWSPSSGKRVASCSGIWEFPEFTVKSFSSQMWRGDTLNEVHLGVLTEGTRLGSIWANTCHAESVVVTSD